MKKVWEYGKLVMSLVLVLLKKPVSMISMLLIHARLNMLLARNNGVLSDSDALVFNRLQGRLVGLRAGYFWY